MQAGHWRCRYHSSTPRSSCLVPVSCRCFHSGFTAGLSGRACPGTCLRPVPAQALPPTQHLTLNSNSAPVPRHPVSVRPAAHCGQHGSPPTPSSAAAMTPTVLLPLSFARGHFCRYWIPAHSVLWAVPPLLWTYIKGVGNAPPLLGVAFSPPRHTAPPFDEPLGSREARPDSTYRPPPYGLPCAPTHAEGLTLRTGVLPPGRLRPLTHPRPLRVTTQPIASAPPSAGHLARGWVSPTKGRRDLRSLLPPPPC